MKYLRITQPLHYKTTELHQIGYVHSTQGLKGDLFIALKSQDDAWIEEWEDLILSPRGESGETPSKDITHFLNFEIQHLRPHKKQNKTGYAVHLYDLDDVNDVEPLISYTVWIPKHFLEAKDGENIFLKEIEGFTVIDKTRGEIGPIVAFSSNGVQDLIEVAVKDNTFYVPLVKAFIERIDKKNKKIYMNIPDGLLE
jgi:16S rRNA processing protein RimM